MKIHTWVPMVAMLLASGQTRIDLQTQSKAASGASLPASCRTGEQFVLTSAAAGRNLYVCLAGNVWAAVREDLPGPAGQGDGKVLASDSAGGASWRSIAGDVSGPPEQMQVEKLSGRKISTSAPLDGDLMKWNEALQQWEPSAVAGNYSVGLGLVLAGSTIGIEDAVIPIYSVGSGAPTGSCVAGRDIYTDSAGGQRWFCKTTNTWQQLALASHTHTASEVASGVLGTSRMPAYSGDATSVAGSATLTVTGMQGRAVDAGAPTQGQVLMWNSTASRWQAAHSLASLTNDYAVLVSQSCTAAEDGLIALPQDSLYDMLRCNGAGTWEHFLGGRRVAPPVSAGWNWVNQGTATASAVAGALTLDLPADNGSSNLRVMVRTAPAAPWRLRAEVRCLLLKTGNLCGLVLRESGNGKMIVFGLAQAGTLRDAPVLVVARYDSPAATPVTLLETAWGGAGDLLLEIRDDGTNRIFGVSADGRLWKTLLTEARNEYLLADEHGAGGEAANPAEGPSVTVLHWEVN